MTSATNPIPVQLTSLEVTLMGERPDGRKIWHVQQKNPRSYQIKEIASPYPEITKTLNEGKLTKFAPWLQARGWTETMIKDLKSAFLAAKIFRPKKALFAVHAEVLNQAVEKQDLEVFKTVPMKFLKDFHDLLPLIDLLKNKILNFPDKKVFKDMDAVIKAVIPEDQYTIFNS
jgi:hypothetical protein